MELMWPPILAQELPTSQVASMRFSELVRLLEANGFRIIKEKGSIR